MRLYLDADIFLALIKNEDRHKRAAQAFFRVNKNDKFITSSLTCLEVWFYLYKNNFKHSCIDAIRAVKNIAEIIDYNIQDVEAAMILAEHHNLSPADSIHAILAMRSEGIVSSDESFDRIKYLKRVNFLKAE